MMLRTDSLNSEEQIRAHDLLYNSLLSDSEKGVKWIALAVAVSLHVVVLLLQFPEFKRAAVLQKRDNVIVVKKYVPPPPRVERRQIVKKKITKKVPIPDPTPDEPEPIREPEPEILDLEPIPPDFEVLIGTPEAPPPPQVLLAGVGDVTNPMLIESSKTKPEYPELARAARIEGNVILQAIIARDGGVGSLEVLRCNRPAMGFEEAAIAAVQSWRYEPATQSGRPVEVYFTVVVDFILHSG